MSAYRARQRRLEQQRKEQEEFAQEHAYQPASLTSSHLINLQEQELSSVISFTKSNEQHNNNKFNSSSNNNNNNKFNSKHKNHSKHDDKNNDIASIGVSVSGDDEFNAKAEQIAADLTQGMKLLSNIKSNINDIGTKRDDAHLQQIL